MTVIAFAIAIEYSRNESLFAQCDYSYSTGSNPTKIGINHAPMRSPNLLIEWFYFYVQVQNMFAALHLWYIRAALSVNSRNGEHMHYG